MFYSKVLQIQDRIKPEGWKIVSNNYTAEKPSLPSDIQTNVKKKEKENNHTC